MRPNKRCYSCRFWAKTDIQTTGICSLHSHPFNTYQDTERVRKKYFDNKINSVITAYYFFCQDYQGID